MKTLEQLGVTSTYVDAFAYWFGWVIGASCATWICVYHNKKKNNEREVSK